MSDDATVESLPPPGLREAITALWRLRPPGPPDLYKAPEFLHLRQTCSNLYANAPSGGFGVSALRNALYALGLPGRPQPPDPNLILPDGLAAARLHAAFERNEARRRYLCPLDRADDLAALTFGPNRVARFTIAELEELVDQPRLRRANPVRMFDAERLSEFSWLVIDETYPLDQPPGQRANPGMLKLLSMPMGQLGSITPHQGRFPAPVEDALFAILLAPWEDWVDLGPFWRGFEVRWVYRTDDDIFAHLSPPPSPDTLSWDSVYGDPVLDDKGEVLDWGEVVGERPGRVSLKADAANIPKWLNDSRWADIDAARKSPLFETPIVHFFVKAFLEEPLDEFLAHITTIEAALLLATEKVGLTKLVKRRVSKLLGDQSAGEVYECLYNLRCGLVHGRRMDNPIPGKARLNARRLARKVVQKLVEAAFRDPGVESRGAYLKTLG